MISPEYWKLPEELDKQREPIYNDLSKLIQAKIEYIQYCYSQNLSENQFKRVKQDEELLDKVSEYTELVGLQFNALLEKYIAICDAYSKLQHGKNQILNQSLNELKQINEKFAETYGRVRQPK